MVLIKEFTSTLKKIQLGDLQRIFFAFAWTESKNFGFMHWHKDVQRNFRAVSSDRQRTVYDQILLTRTVRNVPKSVMSIWMLMSIRTFSKGLLKHNYKITMKLFACWLAVQCVIISGCVKTAITLSPGQTRMRVVESSNSHSRLAWNSHALSATLVRLNFFLESRREFSLVWPEVMIVDESWRKLSWEPTLSISHPRLAMQALHKGLVQHNKQSWQYCSIAFIWMGTH